MGKLTRTSILACALAIAAIISPASSVAASAGSVDVSFGNYGSIANLGAPVVVEREPAVIRYAGARRYTLTTYGRTGIVRRQTVTVPPIDPRFPAATAFDSGLYALPLGRELILPWSNRGVAIVDIKSGTASTLVLPPTASSGIDFATGVPGASSLYSWRIQDRSGGVVARYERDGASTIITQHPDLSPTSLLRQAAAPLADGGVALAVSNSVVKFVGTEVAWRSSALTAPAMLQGSTISARAIAESNDGSLFVLSEIIGTEAFRHRPTRVVLTRLQPLGERDSGFGMDGVVELPQPVSRASGITLRPDGSLIAYGTTSNGDIALVRITGRGVIDESFGLDGPVGSRAGLAVIPVIPPRHPVFTQTLNVATGVNGDLSVSYREDNPCTKSGLLGDTKDERKLIARFIILRGTRRPGRISQHRVGDHYSVGDSRQPLRGTGRCDVVELTGRSGSVATRGGGDVVYARLRAKVAVDLGVGNDELFVTGSASTRAVGGPGQDVLSSSSRASVTFRGGTGRDVLLGGNGADVLDAVDGRGGDRVHCGASLGNGDHVEVDRGDSIQSCSLANVIVR